MAVVNSEGEVPSDLAEEPAMKDLLLEQVKKQGEPGPLGQRVSRPLRATPCRGAGGGRAFRTARGVRHQHRRSSA